MNKTGSAAEGSLNSNAESVEARLRPFASEVLTHFESTAAKAEAAFAADGRVSVSSLATINTLNADRALENLGRASAANRSDLYLLRSEPAIARLVVVDERDRQRTIFIVRGAPPFPSDPHGPLVASYRSPMGRLAAGRLGADIEINTPGGVKEYKLRERAALRPTKADGEWDAKDTLVEALAGTPVTVVSLRALLHDDGEDHVLGDLELLEALLAEERSSANVFEGRRRAVIQQMGLRDQPLLDQYQDEIFRLPLDTQLAILGPPGSGKTTTLIKRLGLKLDEAHLEADELAIVDRSVARQSRHGTSWLMFTPNELLKLYVREAFAREGIPASDQRIQTWDDYRRELARQRLGILRTSTGSGAILRENLGSLREATVSDQIAWFEDFCAWQGEDLRAELSEHAQRLAENSDKRANLLGLQLREVVGSSGEEIGPDTLIELLGRGRAVGDLAQQVRKTVDDILRQSLARELRQNKALLDELNAFAAGLTDSSDEADDADGDEDEEAPARSNPREEAFEIYKRAARYQARAALLGRTVSKRTLNGRILEWLGTRALKPDDRGEVGRNLQLLDSLRKFTNPIALYVDRIPARYRRFRRTRQEEGRWYADASFQAQELGPLEVDVIILSMLRAAGALFEDRRTRGLFEQNRYTVLNSIRDAYRSQILVDEATDFSPIQLGCMAGLCDPGVRSFLACGDFNQRLTRWGSRSADELRWVSPGIDIRQIVITYRHSRQLRDFAARLASLSGDAGSSAQMPDHAVNEGFDPVLGAGLDGVDLFDWLARRVLEIENITRKLPSIAVLVNGEDRVQEIATELNDRLASSNIRCSACPNGQVRGQDNDVRVFDVQHIKGLEFEAVFFVGVDHLARREPSLFDKYLYVGATRAATFLGLTTFGPQLPERIRPLGEGLGRAWNRPAS